MNYQRSTYFPPEQSAPTAPAGQAAQPAAVRAATGRHRTAPRFDEQGLGGQGLAARSVDRGFSGPELASRTTNTTVDLTEVAQAAIDFYDPVMAELRRAVFDRLRVMNGKHAYNAAELRSERPVGPYAVAFFYRERGPGEFRLRSATRQFLDEGGTEWDLALLLGRLAVIAQVDEPRIQMSDVCDEMRADAEFFGVGVSSIDDANGRWIDRRDTVTSSLDVGGHCFALHGQPKQRRRTVADERAPRPHANVRTLSAGIQVHEHHGSSPTVGVRLAVPDPPVQVTEMHPGGGPETTGSPALRLKPAGIPGRRSDQVGNSPGVDNVETSSIGTHRKPSPLSGPRVISQWRADTRTPSRRGRRLVPPPFPPATGRASRANRPPSTDY